MNGIPNTVDDWNFVRNEFDQVQEHCQRQHPPTSQNLKFRWQIQQPEIVHKAKDNHGTIQIYTAGPGPAHSQSKSFNDPHR